MNVIPCTGRKIYVYQNNDEREKIPENYSDISMTEMPDYYDFLLRESKRFVLSSAHKPQCINLPNTEEGRHWGEVMRPLCGEIEFR